MDLQSRNALLSFLLFVTEPNSYGGKITNRRDFTFKMPGNSSAGSIFPSPTIDRIYPTIGVKVNLTEV